MTEDSSLRSTEDREFPVAEQHEIHAPPRRRSDSPVAAALAELRAAGLHRRLRTVESAQGARVTLDGRSVLLLCSNDYLGLAAHPAVRDAAAEAARRWGAGAAASPLISGTMTPHRLLTEELAAFKGTRACVLFGSGFLANTGVIAALAGDGDVVLSDALNHASLIDGCRYARAETVVYPHGDVDAVAAALRAVRGRRALIVTDAVFSMDGDLAPLAELVELARRHGARLLVDEAHATGVVGPGGRGLVAALGLEREVDVVIGTLGKALGSYGAFACCDEEVADLLINRARTFIYSTAPAPPAVGAARAALRLLREQPALLKRLHDNVAALRAALAAEGFAVPAGATPIVPLHVGDAEAAVAVSEAALERGVFVQAIRPPTVPPGTSRLRIVPTAAHDPADLRAAARVLAEAAAGR